MRPADNQSFLGRISVRRNPMEGNNEEQEELEHLQRHVVDRFADLATPSTLHDGTFPHDPLLSMAWLRKLLDMFLCCEAEFKSVLLTGHDPAQIFKPPLDKLVPEFLELVVKALDIFNAVIILGIESLRHFQKLADIVVPTLEQKPLGDGQVRRAKKALHSVVTVMTLEDKEDANTKSTERTRSFGRKGVTASKDRPSGQVRTLSCSLAKNWSASKQTQAMSSNPVAPKGGEVSTLALPVYNEHSDRICYVGIGCGHPMSREKWPRDSFSGVQKSHLGTIHDCVARQDFRGLEEREERISWIVG